MRPCAKWRVPKKTIMAFLALTFVAAGLANPVSEPDVKKMTTGWPRPGPTAATRRLVFSVDLNVVKNPNAMSVWLRVNDESIEIRPGELKDLREKP